MLQCLIKCLAVLWASPATAIGLVAGGVAMAGGARARFRDGCIEFSGRGIARLFHTFPGTRTASAMTLGHVILGRSESVLREVAEHERIHVRQCERWGPLFLPAYLLASLFLWLRGKHPYWDNPFEVEAYRHG